MGPLNAVHYRETRKARDGNQPLRFSDIETPRKDVPVVEIETLCLDFVKLTVMLPLTVPEIRMLSRPGVSDPEALPPALNVRSSQLPDTLLPLTRRLLRM